MTGPRIALDAEERRRASADPIHDRGQADAVEDLLRVEAGVFGSQDRPGGLAPPQPFLLPVLQLGKLVGRRQLLPGGVDGARPPPPPLHAAPVSPRATPPPPP